MQIGERVCVPHDDECCFQCKEKQKQFQESPHGCGKLFSRVTVVLEKLRETVKYFAVACEFYEISRYKFHMAIYNVSGLNPIISLQLTLINNLQCTYFAINAQLLLSI